MSPALCNQPASAERGCVLTAALLSLALSTACIPYSVGNTAQTMPRGERSNTSSLYIIPNGVALRDSVAATLWGIDNEYRYGLDDHSDVGLRIPSGTGIVVNYKRRLAGSSDLDSAAVAMMFGAGFVNVFLHAHFEASLLASGAAHGHVMPYGGLRVMQVAPISSGAVHKLPTAGGLIGLRLGDSKYAVLPELAVYYDHSSLGIRKGDIIWVPSISVRGDLLRLITGRLQAWKSQAAP